MGRRVGKLCSSGGGEIDDDDDVEDVGKFTKLSRGFMLRICCISSSR